MSKVATNDTLLEGFLHIRSRRPDGSNASHTGAAVNQSIGLEQWERTIDTLLEWRKHPEQIEDDDLLPIPCARLDDALRIAGEMKALGLPAPMRVIPNTEGGVSFERWHGDLFEVIEIDVSGNIEVRTFKGDRLIDRVLLEIRR